MDNNFALKVLAGPKCCQGNHTDPIHLENAKALITRFTFVLDVACLDAGMQSLADELDMGITIVEDQRHAAQHVHPDPRDRIPYPAVYDFLVERNRLDIELYQWSKTISLVDCAALDLP